MFYRNDSTNLNFNLNITHIYLHVKAMRVEIDTNQHSELKSQFGVCNVHEQIY